LRKKKVIKEIAKKATKKLLVKPINEFKIEEILDKLMIVINFAEIVVSMVSLGPIILYLYAKFWIKPRGSLKLFDKVLTSILENKAA